MRDALHPQPTGGRTAPGLLTLGTASWLVLSLLAIGSCSADRLVEPHTEIVLHDVRSGGGALTRIQHVKVRSLADGPSIRGSNAILKRQNDGLTVRVQTKELDPNESVDLFWAIFNDPAACTHPNPLTGAPCTPPDLFVGETLGSLHYVTTLSADALGKLVYSASLALHSTAGCVGDPFPCHTLTEPFEAEVHSPLFVPNGGAGRQAAQFFAP